MTRLTEVEGTVRNIQSHTPAAIRQLLLRIEGEYREMPGLSLTVSQAERLWGLDSSTCAFGTDDAHRTPDPKANEDRRVSSRVLRLIIRATR